MSPNCLEKVKPLTDLTKKGVKFKWGLDQELSFLELKGCLLSSPILAFPMINKGKFILDCDACIYGISGILQRDQDGIGRVIAHGSHALNNAQQNYCTTKMELYAVVYFVQHFKQYLLVRLFLLRVDHAPIKWLNSFKEPEGILAKWIAMLGAYEYEVQYRNGRQRLTPLAGSRLKNV